MQNKKTLFLINFSRKTQQALIYFKTLQLQAEKEKKEEKFKLSLIDCLLNV